MAAKERFMMVGYTRGARGALVPAQPIQCRDEAEGRRRADKALAAGGKVVGAQVLRIVADEDAGDYGEPEVLASIGDVPEAA